MQFKEMLKRLNIEYDDKIEDFEVNSLLPLNLASKNDISHIYQDKYLPLVKTCNAGAVLVDIKHKKESENISNRNNVVFVQNPHLVFAYLSSFFKTKQIKDTKSKSPNTKSEIFQGAFIGSDVTIGENCIIMPNVVICDNVKIGNNVRIYPNVTIYKGSIIGNNVNIHAGSVIGSDGFGYAHTDDGKHIKIEHFGNVIIEDDVEIGANSTIDRAVFNSTIIKRGAKIDNLVQVAHNCVVGEHNILVSQSGFAGSVTSGKNVICGGQVGVGGHVHIGDFVQIAGKAGVNKNLPPNTKWAGYPLEEFHKWQKMQVRLRKLAQDDKKK